MRIIVTFFFCKHKTAYEMSSSEWSADVCSSDLELVDDAEGVGSVARNRVRRAIGRRTDRARGRPNLRKALDEIVKDSFRSAKGVRGPGDIQHEAVGRIGRDDRRVAAQRPAGELLQRGAIGIRFGIEDLEIGKDRKSTRLNSSH